MFKWMDRVYVNARKKIFKNMDTGEILNLELQDDPDNISQDSETPITAHCLNLAQQELIDDLGKEIDEAKEVAVSDTTPEDKRKVWIKKGKNLAKINSFSAVNTYTGVQTVRVKVNPNSSIVISATKNRIAGVGMTNHLLYGIAYLKQYNKDNQLIKEEAGGAYNLPSGSWSFEWALTTLENCDYIVIDFSNNNGDSNYNTSVTNIQVEYGTQKTEFEPYVNNTISVLNDNGDYEEINTKQLHMYSTEEHVVGIWIDGKPLYQKTIVLPNGTGQTYGKDYLYSDYGIFNVDHVHPAHPSYFTQMNEALTQSFDFYDGNTFKIEAYKLYVRVTATYEHISNSKMVITLEYTKTTD